MNEPEFEFTCKNTLIFVAALCAGGMAAYFNSPWTGFGIIGGACCYLVWKKN